MTLDEYLSDNGLTRAAFAHRIGVSAVHVSRICTGARRVTAPLAAKIIEVTSGAVTLTGLLAPYEAKNGEAA